MIMKDQSKENSKINYLMTMMKELLIIIEIFSKEK
jgi:hypothetical protein